MPNEPPALPAPPRCVYSDDWLLAVDKPAGLLVHPSRLDAHEPDDLLSRLQQHGGQRLWPLHRLDKGTSGVILLARDAATAAALGAAFAEGRVHKRYLALVRGWPADSGVTAQPLARDPELPSTGQPLLAAETRWQRLACHRLPLRTHPDWPDTRIALIAVQPLSGRRHQIRRHFKQLGHPLIGDSTHGKGPLNRALAPWLGMDRLWLHAQHLSLTHPVSGQTLALSAEPGQEWARWLVPEPVP